MDANAKSMTELDKTNGIKVFTTYMESKVRIVSLSTCFYNFTVERQHLHL